MPLRDRFRTLLGFLAAFVAAWLLSHDEQEERGQVATDPSKQQYLSVAGATAERWNKWNAIGTLVMAGITVAILAANLLIVRFNQELVAEPQVRIKNSTAISLTDAIAKVTGSDDFCAPRGFSLEGFSDQKLAQFEIVNNSALVAPWISVLLRILEGPATALTGVLVERMHEGQVISVLSCSDMGLDVGKLAAAKLPQLYEIRLAGIPSYEGIRVSAVYATLRNHENSAKPRLYILVVPENSRFGKSSDVRLFPLDP